jgi:hypothetical protein
MYIEFLRSGKDVIISADIELLSPEPGSKDFQYLIDPESAEAFSDQLGLAIAPSDLLISPNKSDRLMKTK